MVIKKQEHHLVQKLLKNVDHVSKNTYKKKKKLKVNAK
jgi:hypothetical protein